MVISSLNGFLSLLHPEPDDSPLSLSFLINCLVLFMDLLIASAKLSPCSSLDFFFISAFTYLISSAIESVYSELMPGSDILLPKNESDLSKAPTSSLSYLGYL